LEISFKELLVAKEVLLVNYYWRITIAVEELCEKIHVKELLFLHLETYCWEITIKKLGTVEKLLLDNYC
jgi:hypothetical protein